MIFVSPQWETRFTSCVRVLMETFFFCCGWRAGRAPLLLNVFMCTETSGLTWSRSPRAWLSAGPAPAEASPARRSAGPAGGNQSQAVRKGTYVGSLQLRAQRRGTLFASRSSCSFFMLASSSDSAFWRRKDNKLRYHSVTTRAEDCRNH